MDFVHSWPRVRDTTRGVDVTYVSVCSFAGPAMIPGSATCDFATCLFINS